MFCIVFFLADEASDTSVLNKWKCRCSSFEGNQSNSLANCSKSCDCRSGMHFRLLLNEETVIKIWIQF